MRIFAAMSGKRIRLFSTFTALGTLLSMLAGGLAVYFWYAQVSFELTDPAKALIGEATNYGYDVGKRIQAYYKGCLLFGICFLLSNGLLNLLAYRLLERPFARLLAWTGWIVSTVAILIWLGSVFKWSASTLSIVLLSLLLIVALFANRAIWNKPVALKIKLSLLTGANAFILSHAIVAWMFNGSASGYSYLAVALIVTGLQWWVHKSVQYRHIWMQKAFAWFPLVALLGYELALILNQRGVYFNGSGIYFLVLAAGILLWYYKKRNTNHSSISQTLNRLIFPLFITSFFSMAVYSPVVMDFGEMFEMANPANAAMRVFKFGEFPFIDFISSHLLYEQLPQYLYTLLNGYDASLSFMAYGFYYLPLSGFLYYLFFKKLFASGSWAFAVILIVPFVPVLLPTSFVLTLVTLLLSYRLVVHASLKNGTLLLIWTFFLLFWRVDVAAGTLPALVVLGLLHFVKERFSKATLKSWLIPGLSIVLLVGVVYGFWLVTSPDVHSGALRKVHSALGYFGAAQAHAVVRIAPDYSSPIFLLHHFVFPCLVVAILLATAFKWFKSRDKQELFIATSILILGLFYLFNAQRGLVRHGFIEGSDKHLSSFVYVLIPLFLLLWRKWNYPVFLFVFSSSLMVIMAKHGSLDGYSSNVLAMQTLPQKQETLDFSKKIARCQKADNVKTTVDKMVAFLNAELSDEQTFLDFSNTPMLYFYTQRAVPSYFNQSIQNIVTRNTQLHNRLYRQDGGYDIPLVVFSHYPDNWWDNTDGVPNSIRYQNICKEIYQEYAPYQIVAGYQVWKKKELLQDDFEVDSAFFYPRQFKLHQYPSYFQMPEENRESLAQLEPYDIDKYGHSVVINDVEAKIGQYLEVTFKEDNHAETFEVIYTKNGKALGNYTFLTKKGCREYSIPLWSQYNWHLLKPDLVYITVSVASNEKKEELQRLQKIDWYESVVLSEYPLELEH